MPQVEEFARWRIVDLAEQPEQVHDEAATLLVEHFDEPEWLAYRGSRT